MSGEDYANLRALFAVDPWGADRDNYHTAMLLAQQASMHRKKGSPPVPVSRFMLSHHSRPVSDDERVAALRSAIHQGAASDRVH